MTVDTWERAVTAGGYEQGLVPVLFEPWARELVALAGLAPGERVLDAACGTGVVARLAAPALAGTGTVTGLDLNQDMLALARQVCAEVRPAVTWRRASLTDTGLPDAGFDVVFCQQGLQFIADRPAAARELHRVTAPGGRLLVSVWCDPDNLAYRPFADALARHVPELPAAAGFVRTIYGLHDPDELRDLLTAAGFRRVRVERWTRTVRQPSARAWATTFLGAAPIPGIATIDDRVRQRIVEEVAGALAGHQDAAGLAFPIRANVAVAHR
jgi:ubiquinone/menaquinone biosynthesis C-methylase UbiE